MPLSPQRARKRGENKFQALRVAKRRAQIQSQKNIRRRQDKTRLNEDDEILNGGLTAALCTHTHVGRFNILREKEAEEQTENTSIANPGTQLLRPKTTRPFIEPRKKNASGGRGRVKRTCERWRFRASARIPSNCFSFLLRANETCEACGWKRLTHCNIPELRDYDFFAELEHFDANRVKLAYAPTSRVGLSVHLTAKEGCYILHVEKGKANGKT